MSNTQDFSKFGNRERKMARELLKTYGSDQDKTKDVAV